MILRAGMLARLNLGDKSLPKTRGVLVGAVALLAPLLAAAQQAQPANWAHVRAGPQREYPLVMQRPPAAAAGLPVGLQLVRRDYAGQ